MRRIGLAAAAGVVGVMAAGAMGLSSPVFAAADDKPDLKVSFEEDKPIYAKGDAVTLTVTVENAGKANALNVHATTTGSGLLGAFNSGVNWEGPASDVRFNPDHADKGFNLAAGEKKTYAIHGRLNDQAWVQGLFYVEFALIADNGDANVYDNSDGAGVHVTGPKQKLVGTLRKQAKDTGEGFAGVKLAIIDPGYGCAVASPTTAADGTFVVNDLPAGLYEVQYQLPAGWAMSSEEVTRDDYSVYLQLNVQDSGSQTMQSVVVQDSNASAPSSLPQACPAEVENPPAPAGPAEQIKQNTAVKEAAKAVVKAKAAPSARPKRSKQAKGSLPVTGSNSTMLGVAGVALLGAGFVVYLAARRRRVRFTAGE